MKITFKNLFALVAFAGAAAVGLAQTPKIATVDMAYLFDNHYKTAEQNAAFKQEQQRAMAEIERITKEGNALVQEYKSLENQLNGATLSTEAKTQLEQKLSAKTQEIQRKQAELSQLQADISNSLQKRAANFRSLMLDEITAVAVTVAKSKGCNMLFDKSAPLLFADQGFDITQAVLAEINKSKPAPKAP